MRKTYESTDRKTRAAQLRADAEACTKAGFFDFARCNLATANALDRPRAEDQEPE